MLGFEGDTGEQFFVLAMTTDLLLEAIRRTQREAKALTEPSAKSEGQQVAGHAIGISTA